MSSMRQNRSAEAERALEAMRAMVRSGNSESVTLPVDAYRSEDIFASEKEKIFRAGWVLIGRAEQIPKAGDYMCVDLLEEPLVMVRGKGGELRVLSRVCRHRWMDVCQSSGNTAFFVCPYHLWSYELDGRLRSAPDMKGAPSFDKSSRGLTEVRHEVWEGFVFVNLSGTAKPLAERLTPLTEALKEYELSGWRWVKTYDEGECQYDWKVFQDNGDGYHNMGLHKNTIEELWPTHLTWTAENNGHFSLVYEPVSKDHMVAGGNGEPIMETFFPAKKGLTSTQRSSLVLFYVFPNYFIGLNADSCIVTRIFPLGPGRIRFYWDILLLPAALAMPDFDERFKKFEEFVRKVNDEDILCCTSVQRNLMSRYALPAPLCKLEQHNRDFALWVARQLTA